MKITDKFEFIKGKPARNRIVMAPMDTLMGKDGFANDFHIQHYGARAYGGVGTIILESTAISSEGRIRSGDIGIYKNEHIEPLSRVAKIIKLGGALAGIQLNHAGAKSEIADETRYGAGAKYYEYLDQSQLKLMNDTDIKTIEDKFVKAAHRAKKAGFDFVEIHAAHGYLLNEFINPFLNDIIDSKDILVRAKIILNILKRIKEEVKIPMGIRMSVHDHVSSGMTPKDYAPLINALEKYVDFFDVSSGETLKRIPLSNVIAEQGNKLYRINWAKEIKLMTNKPLIMAGNINCRKDVDYVLSNNIDAVSIGRELLFNPNFVLVSLLKPKEIDRTLYTWNDSPWYNHADYVKTKI